MGLQSFGAFIFFFSFGAFKGKQKKGKDEGNV